MAGAVDDSTINIVVVIIIIIIIIETLAEVDFIVQHRPGTAELPVEQHCNADGLSRPFCKQRCDRPSHTPWVDEMKRADAVVGPWSVHLLEIAPQLTDNEAAQMQDADEVLGPIKSALSQGTALPWMICAPCRWKAENFGPCGRPSFYRIRFWPGGMEMPFNWWFRSLYATSS